MRLRRKRSEPARLGFDDGDEQPQHAHKPAIKAKKAAPQKQKVVATSKKRSNLNAARQRSSPKRIAPRLDPARRRSSRQIRKKPVILTIRRRLPAPQTRARSIPVQKPVQRGKFIRTPPRPARGRVSRQTPSSTRSTRKGRPTPVLSRRATRKLALKQAPRLVRQPAGSRFRGQRRSISAQKLTAAAKRGRRSPGKVRTRLPNKSRSHVLRNRNRIHQPHEADDWVDPDKVTLKGWAGKGVQNFDPDADIEVSDIDDTIYASDYQDDEDHDDDEGSENSFVDVSYYQRDTFDADYRRETARGRFSKSRSARTPPPQTPVIPVRNMHVPKSKKPVPKSKQSVRKRSTRNSRKSVRTAAKRAISSRKRASPKKRVQAARSKKRKSVARKRRKL